MKIIIPILFFAIASFAHAQDSFEKRYWGIQNVYSSGIIVISDSSIIVIANDSINNRIFHIIKTDKNGVFQWMKTDSSSRADNYFLHDDYSSFVSIPARDGSIIICCARHDTTITNTIPQTTSIVKIDTAGNIIWNKTYSKPFRLNSICQTSDSGFLFIGQSPDTIVSSQHYSNGMTKIDSAGNILWTKVFQGGDDQIIQTDDGGYLKEGGNTIAKLDANGNFIRGFHISNRNYFYGQKERKAVKINSNAYAFANYGYLTCYDSTANLLWDRIIPVGWGWWISNRSIVDVARLNDSTIVLLEDQVSVWPDAFIEEIDLSGNVIQETEYLLNEKVIPYSLITLNDGRLLITGTDDLYQDHSNTFLLIKTDSAGYTGCGDTPTNVQDSIRTDTLNSVSLNYIAGSNNYIIDSIVSYANYITNEDLICYQVTATAGPIDEGFQFSISPNPSNGFFTLKGLASSDKAVLEIFNPLGEIVYSENLGGKTEYLFDTRLSKGIYVVRLYDGNNNLVKKFIIE